MHPKSPKPIKNQTNLSLIKGDFYNESISCGLYLSFINSYVEQSYHGNEYTSVDLCIEWCSESNMLYAVLNSYCYCSNNSLADYLVENMTSYDGKCGPTCSMDSNQYCGGTLTYFYWFVNITSKKI